MKRLLALALAFASFALFPSFVPSASAFEVTGLLGGNFYAQKDKSTTGVDNAKEDKSKFGFALGALVAFDVAPMLSIESGFLSSGNKFHNDTTGADVSFRSLEIPVTLQATVLDVLQVGGGLYFERFGDLTVEGSSVTAANGTFSQSAAGYKGGTMGLTANGRVKFPFGPVKLVGDLSLRHGLSNRMKDSSGDATHHDNAVALLVGAAFGF